MSQNRDAPAYQEYAATMLSRLTFRTMSLQDRGLLYTMRLECWVNVQLPSNSNDLAKVLGLPIEQVAESLAAVKPFFAVVDGFIISPELEDYRTHLAERKIKQSQGGKRGSAITNSKRSGRQTSADPENTSMPASTSRLTRQVSSESSVQHKSAKQNKTQLPVNGVIADPFIAEYEAEERRAASAYASASGGD